MYNKKGDNDMKKRVNITIEDWLLKSLDEEAKKRGLDRSTLLSMLVYDNVYLDSAVDPSVNE